jgi:HEAT repeat-containing protein 5
VFQYYIEAWPGILQAVATAMQANDPHILTAMDGIDHNQNNTSGSNHTSQDEPRPFFFVIFGLVYEALATSSAESISVTSTRQPAVIAALRALKHLVRPEYSGKAIMEPTIFDEFISLCYRMAMTEPADVQTHLVETVAALATSQGDSTPGNTKYFFSCCFFFLAYGLLVMIFRMRFRRLRSELIA